MRVFSFATDEQLDAGSNWHYAIIEHLDREARPGRFRCESDRDKYFGIKLPERIDSLNTVEAFNVWIKSKSANAPGCDFLRSLWESIRDLEHIRNEQMWRGN